MAVTIEKTTAGGSLYTLTEKTWTTVDGKVVSDGDPAAHQLVGPAGYQITTERAKALGLVSDEPTDAEAPADEPEPKRTARRGK